MPDAGGAVSLRFGDGLDIVVPLHEVRGSRLRLGLHRWLDDGERVEVRWGTAFGVQRVLARGCAAESGTWVEVVEALTIDRRYFDRVETNGLRAVLRSADGLQIMPEAAVADLSLVAVGLFAECAVEPGERVEITFTQDGREVSLRPVVATVVRIAGDDGRLVVGCEFESIAEAVEALPTLLAVRGC